MDASDSSLIGKIKTFHYWLQNTSGAIECAPKVFCRIIE